MTDLNKYLNEIFFTVAVDNMIDLNCKDCHSVHEIYVSPIVKDQVTVLYDFHYDGSANRIIDSLEVIIKKSSSNNEVLTNLNSLESVKEYYENVININKKIKLYTQWQNRGFAKESMKNGLKDLRNGIADWVLAVYRTLKIKLGVE